MNKTTKTIIILGVLTLGGYLVYKNMKPKGTTPTPTGDDEADCPKCTTLKCSEGFHPEQVGECGCECVADDKVQEDVVGTPNIPTNYDYKPLLDLIEKVYVDSSFVFNEKIKNTILNELKKMSLDELKTTQAFFTASLNDQELPQDVDSNMDLVFSKYPLIGEPIIKQSEIDQQILSVSRRVPEGEGGGVNNSFADTMDVVSEVAGVLAGAAALVASAPVAATIGAIWGIAKGIARLFRKRKRQ